MNLQNIDFRVKLDDGTYVYANNEKLFLGYYDEETGGDIPYNTKNSIVHCYHNDEPLPPDIEIQFWTGLNDEYDNKIYEGDKVKVHLSEKYSEICTINVYDNGGYIAKNEKFVDYIHFLCINYKVELINED